MTSPEFLEMIVKELVSSPNEVRIEAKQDERGTVLIVDVAVEDRGTIIGKGGVNANALRQLLAIVGHKNGESIGMSISGGREFHYGQ